MTPRNPYGTVRIVFSRKMSFPSRSIQSPKTVDPPRSSDSFRPFRTGRAFGLATCEVGGGPFQFHVDFELVLFLCVEELERHGLGGRHQKLLQARQDLGEIDRTWAQSRP